MKKKIVVDYIHEGPEWGDWNQTFVFDGGGHLLNWHEGRPNGKENGRVRKAHGKLPASPHAPVVVDWAHKWDFTAVFRVKVGSRIVACYSISEKDERIFPRVSPEMKELLARSESPDAPTLMTATPV